MQHLDQTGQPVAVPRYESGSSIPQQSLLSHPKDAAEPNGMEVDIALSGADDKQHRGTSVLSLDDIEAAQALEGLRSGKSLSLLKRYSSVYVPYAKFLLRTDFRASPKARSQEASKELGIDSPTGISGQDQSHTPQTAPEPLLSLLTSHHPLLGTAINGSMSVYTSSKSYSSSFRTTAEFIERNLGTPVVNTVGSAGRITGVETGVRRFLQKPQSRKQEPTRETRRLLEDVDKTDIEQALPEYHESLRPITYRYSDQLEPLPAYDDQRSPSYEEQDSASQSSRPRSPRQSAWPMRLMVTTSALGVALSDESLRSLKYCLGWLKWANGHLNRVVLTLRGTIKEYHDSQRREPDGLRDTNHITRDSAIAKIDTDSRLGEPRDPAAIVAHIEFLKSEVAKTIKKVNDVVSKYAGGALPENARNLVRSQLTSLPSRFRYASEHDELAKSPSPGCEADEHGGGLNKNNTITSAQRMVILATEGLSMISQVSGVLDGTITSAEEWCERLGRRRTNRPNAERSIEGVEKQQLKEVRITGDMKDGIPEMQSPDVDVEMHDAQDSSLMDQPTK